MSSMRSAAPACSAAAVTVPPACAVAGTGSYVQRSVVTPVVAGGASSPQAASAHKITMAGALIGHGITQSLGSLAQIFGHRLGAAGLDHHRVAESVFTDDKRHLVLAAAELERVPR